MCPSITMCVLPVGTVVPANITRCFLNANSARLPTRRRWSKLCISHQCVQPVYGDSVMAMPLDDKTVNKIQELLTANIDSQKGFEEAAGLTKDPDLKQLFSELSQNRSTNADELRQFITSSGQQAKTSGTVAGTL